MEGEYPVLCIRCTKCIGWFTKPQLDAVCLACKGKEVLKKDEARRKKELDNVEEKLMYSSYGYYRDDV